YYLRTMGYEVTIYESKERPGGMTMYGIPKYRLPLEIIDREINLLKEIGVSFRFNTLVGKDISFEEIYSTSDAVFLGIGFELPYKLAIPGEELKGSIQAIDYLRDINSGKQIDLGNKIVVIGGGNVAMDAARVSRRSGAEVTMLYRRRIVDMPADPEEIEGAEHEGVNIISQTIPVAVSDDGKGNVKSITYLLAKMEDDPKGGRPRPVPIEGSETTIEASSIIGAIGQETDFALLNDEWMNKLEVSKGRIVTNSDRMTSIEKLFAGGDSVNKTADAISAIADGYKAARGIDKLLNS
ncbi:MAG: FAD-dependent oxidoreductase, partial [Bacteroidota bacterium]